MLNPLVHNQPVNKGLQWAVFVPTDYNGLQCVIRLSETEPSHPRQPTACASSCTT